MLVLMIRLNAINQNLLRWSLKLRKIAMLKQQAQKLEFTPLEFETVPNRANRY